ncbi:MAG TPA: hypothetical protein ENO30_06625 [Thermodesulfobium narugense]|nr:hypothetical protein [Thermodesulfobium narugense]
MDNVKEIAILEMVSNFLGSVLSELEGDVVTSIYMVENEQLPDDMKQRLFDVIEYYNSLVDVKNTVDIVRYEGTLEDMSELIERLSEIKDLLPDDLRSALEDYTGKIN